MTGSDDRTSEAPSPLTDPRLATLRERLIAASGDPLDATEAATARDVLAGWLTIDPTTTRTLAARLLDRVAPDDVLARAHARRAWAEALLFAGELDGALRAYESATRAAERAGEPRLLGQVLVGRIGALGMAGSTASVSRLAARAARLLERMGDAVYLGKLHMNVGNLAYNRDDHPRAEAAYRAALAAFSDAGIRDAAAVGILLNLGVVLTQRGNLEDAQAHLARAARDADDLGLERVRAQAELNLAWLERARGSYRPALTLLARAARAFAALEVPDMSAAAAREEAEVHLELGIPEAAIEPARDAVERFDAVELTLDAMLARRVLAEALSGTGAGEEALALLDTVEHWFRSRRLTARRVATLLARSRVARAAGDLTRARRDAREARRLTRSPKGVGLAAAAGDALGRVELDARRPARALEALETARKLGGTRLSTGRTASLHEALGRAHRLAGDVAAARRHLTRAARLGEVQRRAIPGLEYRARTFDVQASIYAALVSIELERRHPRPEHLLALTEAARGRALGDQAAIAPDARSRELEEARAEVGALSRRLESLERGTHDEAEDPIELRRRLGRAERRLRAVMGRVDPGTGPEQFDGPRLLEGVGRRRRVDETVVSYFVHEGRVLALVIDGDGVERVSLGAGIAEIASLTRSLHLQLELLARSAGGGPDPRFLERSTRSKLVSLYEALVAPLALGSGAGRLTVVPHGPLHNVPFECLHDGGTYLDDRWCIARTPTVRHFGRPRRRVRARERLVVSVDRMAPSGVVTEGREVAARLAASGARHLRNPTTDELIEAASRARLLHIAAHGTFREDNPLFSSLATGSDELFLADVVGRRLDAELVVLSACNSGRVWSGRGEDLSGVAHAFLAAGARTLVASHWRVHDAATLALMIRFHEGDPARTVRDPAGTLHRARRAVREEWAHPFYWGGFGCYLG